ncbi:MAG: RidA family protein [Phycisphaerales bacterium]|nr:MAG: RidA family protein [Phycisphaerales bacterium]
MPTVHAKENPENLPHHVENRLQELGIKLPEAPKPVASYVPVRVVGNLAFVSGQIPVVGGKPVETGIVPTDVSSERAKELARLCAINALAAVKAGVGSLDRIRGVIRLGGFVAATPEFTGHPGVINGASDLMLEIFGESGRHARAAVGASSLPLGVPVEVEFVFEIGDDEALGNRDEGLGRRGI